MNARTLVTAAEAWDALAAALREGLVAAGPEEALAVVTRCTVDLLGDRAAHLRPGGLKQGERQYAVAAVVMVSPDRRQHMFMAQQNFPPEQLHMRIPIEHGHPGEVWRAKQALLLANTDEHASFKQILKSSRMGSSYYAPIWWRGEMIGQLIAGAQARHTYRPVDLEIAKAFADVAGVLWQAHRGPVWLAALR
ncbi:MAG: GAF domain-containing protein [Alphaproteobacteria bacterium]|nr:GAF domain-containing protein [Alphaproteobacteria bacterium]